MIDLEKLLKKARQNLVGKDDKVTLALCAVLAQGHVLIEDLPGVGKTTLAKTIGSLFELRLNRVQFTNDILPSDIVGTSIFSKEEGSFNFHQGPIFGDIILADELNRAPAKTQSALLQAMEEKKVTVDGENYQLSNNFIVFATQNPSSQIGTFDLPESQLDRFCFKFNIGYPDKSSSINMFKSNLGKKFVEISSELNSSDLTKIRTQIEKIHIDDSLYDYIYRLLDFSRTSASYQPLSNRCGLDLVKSSKAYAYLQNRDYVTPDDLQFLFPYIAGHRLVSSSNASITAEHTKSNELLANVDLRP